MVGMFHLSSLARAVDVSVLSSGAPCASALWSWSVDPVVETRGVVDVVTHRSPLHKLSIAELHR